MVPILTATPHLGNGSRHNRLDTVACSRLHSSPDTVARGGTRGCVVGCHAQGSIRQNRLTSAKFSNLVIQKCICDGDGRAQLHGGHARYYIYTVHLSLSLTHTHMHTQHCPPLPQVSPLHRSPSDSRRSTLERSRRRRTSGGRRTRARHPNDRYHAHTARVRAAYASHYGYGCSRASFPHYCYCSPPANTSPPPILRPAAARPAARMVALLLD